MIIIGADFHPEFQQIAYMDTTTGEFERNDACDIHRRRRSSIVTWRNGVSPYE